MRSLGIELGTSCTEDRALTNCAIFVGVNIVINRPEAAGYSKLSSNEFCRVEILSQVLIFLLILPCFNQGTSSSSINHMWF